MTERMWYFAAGGKQEGPVSESQLKALFDAGSMLRSTLVWSDKLTNWTAAGELEEFAPPPAPPMPPPLPQAPVPPPMPIVQPAAPVPPVQAAPQPPVQPVVQLQVKPEVQPVVQSVVQPVVEPQPVQPAIETLPVQPVVEQVPQPQSPVAPPNPFVQPQSPAPLSNPFAQPQTPVAPPNPFAQPQSPAEPANPFAQSQSPAAPPNPFAQPQSPASPANPFAQPQSPVAPPNPFAQTSTDEQQATRPMANPFAKPSFGQPSASQPSVFGQPPPPTPGPSVSQESSIYEPPKAPKKGIFDRINISVGGAPQYRVDSSMSGRPRPWIRWFARGVDFYMYEILFQFVVVIATFLASLAGSIEILRFSIFTILMGIGWVSCFILLEPIVVSFFGTTAGKAIANIEVTNEAGGRLSFQQAFARYFAMLLRTGFLCAFLSIFLSQLKNPILGGIALFLLFVQIGLCIYQYFQIEKNNITSWDRDMCIKYKVPELDSLNIVILGIAYIIGLAVLWIATWLGGLIIASIH